MIELAPNNAYGLPIRSPVMVAAGCAGYGMEYAHAVDLAALGALVTPSTSWAGQPSKSPPKLVETPAGVLWSRPWDAGIEHVVRRYAPIWASWSLPVLLSLVGRTIAEYVEMARLLEGIEGLAGLELNQAGDLNLASVVAAVRSVTLLPILAKLPLHQGNVAGIACQVVDAGADGLVLCSSPPALAIDPFNGERVAGYLSGPALRPLVLHALAELSDLVEVPLIGCGGIVCAADVRAYLQAGAAAVQIGAAALADPLAPVRIAHELMELPNPH